MNSAPPTDLDVLIVGARVAGASLALLLGERGHRVGLIDRDRFPSDTLSTHYLAPNGIALLEQLGVLQDVEAAGFRRITRSRACVGGAVFEGAIITPEGNYGLAPRRDTLDTVLIEHAVRRGQVSFSEHTSATRLLKDADRVTGVCVALDGGAEREIRARVVVGADGRASRIAKWVGAASYREVPALRPVYYGYFRDVLPLFEPMLEQFYVEDRIGFVFPMQPGLDCLALEIQPEEFETFRRDPATAFEDRFRTFPGMTARLAGARLEGKIHGVRGIPNYVRTPFGCGWTLTGDAAYLKDPLTGTGITDALRQSVWLADALDDVLHGADWDERLGNYQQQRDETLLPIYQITLDSARLRDLPRQESAWLDAVMCSPAFARLLAMQLPRMIPDLMPENLHSRITKIAELFGATESIDISPGSAKIP
jgi:2-polyprenyl-6-methoxyphenol hydroxylase-like FAD-dependent oxidoreductase